MDEIETRKIVIKNNATRKHILTYLDNIWGKTILHFEIYYLIINKNFHAQKHASMPLDCERLDILCGYDPATDLLLSIWFADRRGVSVVIGKLWTIFDNCKAIELISILFEIFLDDKTTCSEPQELDWLPH